MGTLISWWMELDPSLVDKYTRVFDVTAILLESEEAGALQMEEDSR